MSLVVHKSSRNNGISDHMNGYVVRVYRKTEQDGWQSMQPKNAKGRLVQVRATPKQGCIVLHRIQVRIRLKSSEEKEDDNNSGRHGAADTTKSKGSVTNDVLVVRRRHYILISSKLRSRSLVFKFKDLRSCLLFSDQLVQLNPNQTIQTTTLPFDRNGTMLEEVQELTEQNNLNTLTREKDLQQILSYVARLLYDANFAKFCNDLESNIMSCEDGVQMLNSLIGQSNSYSPQKTNH